MLLRSSKRRHVHIKGLRGVGARIGWKHRGLGNGIALFIFWIPKSVYEVLMRDIDIS